MNNTSKKDQIINALVKFRKDLIFDEFMGIFEKVPVETRDMLYKQYKDAIIQSSESLGISSLDLEEDIESQAIQDMQGRSFSQQDVQERLKEYGIE